MVGIVGRSRRQKPSFHKELISGIGDQMISLAIGMMVIRYPNIVDYLLLAFPDVL